MRNIVAFHVDPGMTERGLDPLAQQERVVLMRGEGRPQRHTFVSVGLEALFMGPPWISATSRGSWQVCKNDQAVGGAVEEAFVLALNAVGGGARDSRWGEELIFAACGAGGTY